MVILVEVFLSLTHYVYTLTEMMQVITPLLPQLAQWAYCLHNYSQLLNHYTHQGPPNRPIVDSPKLPSTS